MLSYKKIFIFSACCFVITVIFGFVAYQAIFEFAIRDQVSLHKRNYVRQFYLKYPIPLDFRVYFFNVTNPDEVENGAIPLLKEIGPYSYDLYKERIDVEDDEEKDSLTYTPHDLFVFNKERSQNLTDDDLVTILNPLVIGMVNYITAKSPHYLSMLNEALPYLFPNTSIYLKAKVRDILFDGVLINCTSRNFAAMAVCSQLKTKISGIKLDGKVNLRYGILSEKNGTVPMRVTVLRGIKNSANLGRLIAVDNVTKLNIWDKEDCNEFKGTDGWIYPPLSKDQRLWFHPADFCMNLHADFLGETTSNGIAVRKFYADFSDRCMNCSQSSCLPEGLTDLTQCIKVPLYISLPHFLRSDEELLQMVNGLQPDEEKHITRVLLEETLSMPIEAQIRIQFNLPVQSNDRISFMQNLTESIHPVAWIELGVVVNGWLLRMVKAFLIFLTIIETVKYLSLLLSLAGMGYAGYLYLNNKKIYSMKNTIILDTK